MGKVNIFSIGLAYPPAVFQAGQWIQGTVVLELLEEMKMRGIYLAFQGKARVHWTERHTTGSGDNRRTETRHYSANETYFNENVCLFGKQVQGNMSGENPVLPAGRYNYPFQFLLPANLPSSYESHVGQVRYSLKATIDKPWAFDEHTKRPFTVISNLDLNLDPNARVPFEGHNEKMICCLCCASGPITASMMLDRRGFVPGESINIKAQIENHSNRHISSTNVVLEQHVLYRAKSSTKRETNTITQMKRGEIQPFGSDAYMNVPFWIPPLPPSYLTGCGIIDIHYYLKLVCDPAGPATELEVSQEIILGTIPLQNVQSVFAQAPYDAGQYYQGFVQPSSGAALPQGAASLNTVTDAPPPSYYETGFGKPNLAREFEGDGDHTYHEQGWAPTYSYYTFDTSNTYRPPENSIRKLHHSLSDGVII